MAEKKKKHGGGIGNDALGHMVGSSLTFGVGPIGGWLHGIMAGPSDDEQTEKMDRSPWKSYIPGVGTSRIIRKAMRTARSSDNPRASLLSETLGSLTSTGAVMLASALIGAGIGKGDLNQRVSRGVSTGMMMGAGITGANALAAAVTKRRTLKEQEKHDRDAGNRTLNWWMPGQGVYNLMKRIGVMYTDEDKRNERYENEDVK